MKYIIALFTLASVSAQANSSACVAYMDNNTTPVKVQFSCDGSDLQDLFEVGGISAGISKSVSHFMNQGYELNACLDGYVPPGNVNGGYTYARCIFTKR